MAPVTATFGWIDHSAEGSRTKLHFEAVASDGSNFEDVFGAAGTGAINDVRVALELVTKLNEVHVTGNIVAHSASGTPPTDATAQREIAARMTYIDTVTNKKYRFDIPAPADAYVPTGSDIINMGAAVWVAFKTTFEAGCVSELGNPVSLLSGEIVGRRN